MNILSCRRLSLAWTLAFQGLILVGISLAPIQAAFATAAFARATGANCDKCHTANFPHLNFKGERFLRNGFQLRQEAPVEFGLGDDKPGEAEKSRTELQKISDLFAIGGSLEVLHAANTDSSPALSTPLEIDLYATGSLAKDTPIYAAVAVENDATMLHRFILGKTNIGGSTFSNVRIGTLDPTTWTSFYGFGATLDSAAPAIGAYGSSHSGGSGFTAVGAGYREKQAIEYYGYNDLIILALGLSNGASAAASEGVAPTRNYDPLDYWTSARLELGPNGSVSLLWYNANGYVNNQTFTFAGNLRTRALDVRFQYSVDNTGGAQVSTAKTLSDPHAGHKPVGVISARHGGAETSDGVATGSNYRSGFTVQADYLMNAHISGLFRFDTTDNGAAENSVETQLTFGVLYKPQANVKVTAAYVSELSAASATEKFGDHGTLQVRFVF